jgi:glycine cleavage system H protein
MNVPESLRYTSEHEWVRAEGADGVVGITDFAQASLGDVVFVELPTVGALLEQGQTFGVVESNKAVSDLYAPVSGEVVAVNEALGERPELVNEDPYGEGWLLRVRMTDAAQTTGLLDADSYGRHVESEQGT